MSEPPFGTRVATLGSLVKITGGGTPSKSVPDYYLGDIPWVTPKDLKQWFIDDSVDHITERAVAESTTAFVEPGAVLICIRSGVLAHTLPVAINRVRVTLNQDLKALVCGRELLPAYLARFLKWYSPQLLQTVRGTTAHNLSMDVVRQIEVPLPTLPEQKRIAAILDAADALRAKRRESIEQLDSLIQATFLEMFGDPVTNPRGWPRTTLGEIAGDTFRNGLSPSTKGTHQGEVLTLSAITSGRFRFEERKAAVFDRAPAASQCVTPGTFLICRGNGNKSLVGVGVFPDVSAADVCFPDTMIGATVDARGVTAAYLQSVWNMQGVRQQIEAGARTTNGTYKINQQLLAAVAMPLPPLDLQTRFASNVESIEQQKARLKAHLAELDTLFASLQSRAFNGELVA
jgi:type I restriction enzyme S subunit